MTLPQSILATLAYHDIFDYPLTKEEIHKFLIEKKSTPKSVDKVLSQLLTDKKIGEKQNYYYLAGKAKIVKLRLQRAKFSQAKLKRARFFAYILKVIPTIKLVAVSGALAMQNSHKSDDIDLVIITSLNSLWTSRFFANLALLPFKRNPHSPKVSDRACLNTFFDERDLRITPPNLYLAHEICQMKLLWERGETYSRFIKANRWVLKFLPNWRPQDTVNSKWKMVNRKSSPKKVYSPFTINDLPIEKIFKSFQLWYMRPKITTEKIGEHQLFFHPTNTAEWVMEEYQKRIRSLKIPLRN